MILVLGEALVDLVIDPAGNVAAAFGGAPYNTARACGRLGADVAFAGALSNDRFGSLMTAQLAADGVDVSRAPRVEVPTTLAAAELDEQGAASYRFYIEGTSAPALSPVAVPSGVDVVFTGGLGLVLQPMADTIEAALGSVDRADTIVMVDVNCRPRVIPDRDEYVARVARVVSLADVVKVSDEDLAYLAPDAAPLAAARSLLDLGPACVLVTAGGGAVTVVTRDRDAMDVPVQPVAVVDTIGAGDTFAAAFMVWWLDHGLDRSALADRAPLRAAVAAASTAAGIVCGRRGADPPWRHEFAHDWSA